MKPLALLLSLTLGLSLSAQDKTISVGGSPPDAATLVLNSLQKMVALDSSGLALEHTMYKEEEQGFSGYAFAKEVVFFYVKEERWLIVSTIPSIATGIYEMETEVLVETEQGVFLDPDTFEERSERYQLHYRPVVFKRPWPQAKDTIQGQMDFPREKGEVQELLTVNGRSLGALIREKDSGKIKACFYQNRPGYFQYYRRLEGPQSEEAELVAQAGSYLTGQYQWRENRFERTGCWSKYIKDQEGEETRYLRALLHYVQDTLEGPHYMEQPLEEAPPGTHLSYTEFHYYEKGIPRYRFKELILFDIDTASFKRQFVGEWSMSSLPSCIQGDLLIPYNAFGKGLPYLWARTAPEASPPSARLNLQADGSCSYTAAGGRLQKGNWSLYQDDGAMFSDWHLILKLEQGKKAFLLRWQADKGAPFCFLEVAPPSTWPD